MLFVKKWEVSKVRFSSFVRVYFINLRISILTGYSEVFLRTLLILTFYIQELASSQLNTTRSPLGLSVEQKLFSVAERPKNTIIIQNNQII